MFKKFRSLALAVSVVIAGPNIANAVALSGKTMLESNALWEKYREQFIKTDGRVIDTLNSSISHSEGQGFAMALAVAANDPKTFKQLYGFAREALAIRSDALFAWRFDPASSPPVSDLNNASDGDLLIAWALLEAAARGWGDEYREQANTILKDLESLVIEHPVFGRVLKPGELGFDTEEGVVINPSYWVFPALERISQLTGSLFWKRLISSGEQILTQHLETGGKATPDWLVIKPSYPELYFSKEKKPIFGYEAIRAPLYLMLAETTNKELVDRIVESARSKPGSQVLNRFNVKTLQAYGTFEDHGYKAIAAVADCIRNQVPLPDSITNTLDKNYYPATLQLLSLLALNERSQKC